MGTVVVEINVRIFNYKMRSVRAVSTAVDNFDLGICYVDIKGTSKPGTVSVGNKGRVNYIGNIFIPSFQDKALWG